MVKEYEFCSKDYIKLYFLNETVNTKVSSFKLFLESDGVERDFLDVRADGRNVYRFNNFNVSEDVTNNCITFRPNVIGCYVYFVINTSVPIKVELIKNGTNTVDSEFEIGVGEAKLEFQPQGIKKYDLVISVQACSANLGAPLQQVQERPLEPIQSPFESDFSAPSPFDQPRMSDFSQSNSQSALNTDGEHGRDSFVAAYEEFAILSTNDEITSNTTLSTETIREQQRTIDQFEQSNNRLQRDIEELEQKIKELEHKNQELIDSKKNLTSHLNLLQEEFDKDYSKYNSDIEEISSRYHIDEEILKLYSGKEVTPIEELLKKAEDDIQQIEMQIKVFVEAQERKMAEIENELKIGKKE